MANYSESGETNHVIVVIVVIFVAVAIAVAVAVSVALILPVVVMVAVVAFALALAVTVAVAIAIAVAITIAVDVAIAVYKGPFIYYLKTTIVFPKLLQPCCAEYVLFYCMYDRVCIAWYPSVGCHICIPEVIQ